MVQTISTDNATRCSVNNSAIQLAIRTLAPTRRVYVVPARLSRQLTSEELFVLHQLPDSKTGNIPVFLHLYIGMPVRIKTNQCLLKGVANGASGIVHHIDWQPGCTFTVHPNGAWMASSQPSNIFVNITNCPNPLRFPSLPPEWPVSVMPVHQTTASIQISKRSLSIKGFPIVPAFGTTVHGVQGETRDSIAITDLRPPNVRNVDAHALYVSLSRVRTRSGLHWIGQTPSDADYSFFRPNTEVLFEDNRLHRLSNQTIAAFDDIVSSDL